MLTLPLSPASRWILTTLAPARSSSWSVTEPHSFHVANGGSDSFLTKTSLT